MRIEIGYENRGIHHRRLRRQTIREAITAGIPAGQYGAGLLAGTTRLINRIAEDAASRYRTCRRPRPARRRRRPQIPLSLIVFVIFI